MFDRIRCFCAPVLLAELVTLIAGSQALAGRRRPMARQQVIRRCLDDDIGRPGSVADE